MFKPYTLWRQISVRGVFVGGKGAIFTAEQKKIRDFEISSGFLIGALFEWGDSFS